MIDSNALIFDVTATVLTWGEFKAYCLPVIEAACKSLKERKKPKLSIFSGTSFDKTCNKFEKALDKVKADKPIDESDKKKLLKILGEYKGKRSAEKLDAMKKFIKDFEEKSGVSVKKLKNKFEEMKKEFYAKSQDTVGNELYKFKNELKKIVNPLKADKVIDEINLRKIKEIVTKCDKYFDKTQREIMTAITVGVGSALEYLNIYFGYEKKLREVPNRNINIALRYCDPHCYSSKVIKELCTKFRKELEGRFSGEIQVDKKLFDESLKTWNDAEGGLNAAHQKVIDCIEKMKKYEGELSK